ncbi:Molybdopterin oxidoreductase [Pseudomonas sp. IT-232MI5]|uniref:head-tail joining protein n=1 Tax=Pseudomonas sp. IT-232MI5 TaxID=3026442 RepID=UPI0039E1B330
MGFRDLIAEVDAVVFETLGDTARIEGREEPVLGMFAAPWLQPKFGKLNTGLREPRFEIRVSDSQGLEQGMLVSVDLPALDGGGDYDLIQLEPRGDGLVALILRLRP